MRNVLLFVVFGLGIGPALIMSDGGLMTDYRLRSHSLEPVTDVTSLDICRSKFKVYHYCRHHIISDQHDVIYRYRFFAQNRPAKVAYFKSQETGELTTGTGIAYFWKRVVFVLLMVLFGLGTIVHEAFKQGLFKRSPKPVSPDRPTPLYREAARFGGQAPSGFGKRKNFGR